MQDVNIGAIKHHFSNFVAKVESGLVKSNIDFTHFKCYLRHYDPGCPDFDDVSSYFQFFTANKKWNYMNSHHLCEIVHTFGDSTLIKAEKEYKERRSAYLANIAISEYMEDKEKLSRIVTKKGSASRKRRRSSREYRDKLSLKLEVSITTTTMKYIEDLWDRLSYLHLPKIGVILDDIICGSVWVVWLITLPTIAIEVRKNAKQLHSVEFFKNNKIVQVYFCDECLYSAEGEEPSDFINIFQLSTSDSIEEDPLESCTDVENVEPVAGESETPILVDRPQESKVSEDKTNESEQGETAMEEVKTKAKDLKDKDPTVKAKKKTGGVVSHSLSNAVANQ